VFSADELGDLQRLLSQFGLGNEDVQSDKGSKQNKRRQNDKAGGNGKNCPKLDPAQLLTIAGILSGGLAVRSVWVNRAIAV
jgi:hypothetical protein